MDSLKKQNQLDLRSFLIFGFVMSLALYCVLITVLKLLSQHNIRTLQRNIVYSIFIIPYSQKKDALIYEELGATSRRGPLAKLVFACLQTPNMKLIL